MPTQEEQIILLENKIEQLTDLVQNLILIINSPSCPPGVTGPRGKDGIDGKVGSDGEKGKDGLQGAKGYTPIKGIDYTDGEDGLDGKDGKDGINGQASFTSYVFKRITDGTTPARPTGGSYTNPIPTTGDWTDGVTSGQGTLFLSSRIFTDTGLPPQQEQWSLPKLAGDSTTIDFEWSSVTEPGNPTDNPDNWSNESSESSIWMALRTLDLGVWSEWKIMKIKGENGEKGNTGESGNTSIYMYAKNGSFSTPPPLLPPDQKNQRYPTGWSETVPSFSELEYLWKIVAVVNGSNDLVGNWSEPFRDTGRIGDKGDKGAFLAPKGEYSESEQYIGSGERVEAVLYEGNWYVTRSDAGAIPIGTLPTNTAYWNEADESFDFIATGLFLAQVAYIKNLGVENLRTSDEGTRVEIIKEENSLKFYVGSIVQPVVTIDTDVAEDPYQGGTTNAGVRITAMGLGSINAVTSVSTSGVFSNAGNTTMFPASTGIQAVASIVGLSFKRSSAQFDAGVAGVTNVNVTANKNLNAIGGFFDTICHGGTLELSQEVSNGNTLNLSGATSFLFSYMSSGQSATINLPDFDLNSEGWKGEFGVGLDRVFKLRLVIINSNVSITVNGRSGKQIISNTTTSGSYTASTGASERAIFEFIYTGSHWLAIKKTF